MDARGTVPAWTLALLLAAPALGSAQPPPATAAPAERPGRVYASALLATPRLQGVTEDGFQTYVLPPGGFSFGWSALAGVFVSPRASVEFEVSRTGILKRTEPTRYSLTFVEERRDTFFTTAVRLHARPTRAFDIEPVLGFHVVREETWTTTTRLDFQGRLDTSPRFKDVRKPVAGFSCGADLRLGSGHAAFIASFRLHRTFWGSADFEETRRWALVPGAGVRVAF